MLVPMHSNDHILTVCIALPCSTGFFGDAGEVGMEVIRSLSLWQCKE